MISPFAAAVLGILAGYLLRWMQEARKPRKHEQVVQAFDPGTVVRAKPERWVEQEWVTNGTSQYLIKCPVRLDKFYRASWHIHYLGAPFSVPYLVDKLQLLTRAELNATRAYMMGRQWITWRNPSQHSAGVELTQEGADVVEGAASKHRPALEEVHARCERITAARARADR